MKPFMKTTLKTKLFILLILPIILCLSVGIIISTIKLRKNGESALVDKSEAILSRMESVRSYVAGQNRLEDEISRMKELHPDGNLTSEEKSKILKIVPIIASWNIGEDNAAKDNYSFRIAAKNPRNSKNNASAKDLEFLEQFEKEGNKTITYVDKEHNTVNVMRPVYLKTGEGCLKCHGDPATSPFMNGKDIIGFPMENYKDGELRGMFIISSDLKPVQSQIWSSFITITLWGIIIGTLALIIGSFIIRNLKKQLGGEPSSIATITRKIADGNLDIDFSGYGTREGILGAVWDMAEKLKLTVISVVQSAERSANVGHQINASSQEMSEGANSQASAIEEVSSSIEEMAANIQQNADNAKQTEQISTNTMQKLKESNEAVKTSVASMRDIAEKIKIINDIAFQTNILALNAAVEAARAGEHGRGFAVVAAEVRKLAERSKLAANEINILSKTGVDVAEIAGNQFSAIVPEMERTMKLVQEIAAASNEQSLGITQIEGAIDQLNQIAQQNASSSEEMASTASELAHHGEELKNTVSYFNVGNI